MARKSIIITFIFTISTLTQLISQIIVTRIFGATLNLDIFLAAVALPTIIITVIYGTLNDAFLPIYGEKKAKEPHTSDQYFFSSLLTLGFISLLIALILGFFSQSLSSLLYRSRGEVFVQNVAIQMTYMFYSIPLSVIATLLGVYFYAHKKFLRFPVAQLLGSLFNLLLIIILAPKIGVWALVFAFVVNIFFQIIFVIPKLSFDLKLSAVNIIPILIAWLPLIIGSMALRSDTLLIRSFAASLPDGYLVYLNLISKIFSLSTSVMTIGIQILLLPHLVEYFSLNKNQEGIKLVNKAKIISIGVSIIITILVMLLSPVIIKILFVGGKFTPQNANIAIKLLPFFVIPAIGWGINGVFFQPLLALKKQFQLGIINTFALVFGWLAAAFTEKYFGPLPAITVGLIVLLFFGIIGSEILWQSEKKKLMIQRYQ